MSEHAVIVEFQYGSTDLGPLFALEDELIAAIEAAEAGDYDGNEVATDGSDGRLYMYGSDAARLADIVRPILVKTPFMKGARMTLRYGGPGNATREDSIQL